METPGYSPLDRVIILKALGLLNSRLESAGAIGEICRFGGTAMVLAFNARFSTKDVDAIFQPTELFRRLAAEIAEELHLEAGWLNDGVKGYLSEAPEYTSEGLPKMSNLRIIRPAAEYLLAMKCMASRSAAYSTKGDGDDIRFLIRHLGLKDEAAVLCVVEKYYPPERILPKTQFLIQEILAEERLENEREKK